MTAPFGTAIGAIVGGLWGNFRVIKESRHVI
jgi:hypothetical protein